MKQTLDFTIISENMKKETRKFYEKNPRSLFYKNLLLKYITQKAKPKDLLGIFAFCVEYSIFRVKNKVKTLI